MQKYDPEDIEQLMLHKSYDELLEQERAYVLRHLDSKEDYVQMRATLLSIKEGIKQDDFISPSPVIKEDLLALFKEKERKGFWWFLGALFPQDKPLFYRPAMQFATVLVLVFGTFFMLNQFKEDSTQVAYVPSEEMIEEKMDNSTIEIQKNESDKSVDLKSEVTKSNVEGGNSESIIELEEGADLEPIDLAYNKDGNNKDIEEEKGKMKVPVGINTDFKLVERDDYNEEVVVEDNFDVLEEVSVAEKKTFDGLTLSDADKEEVVVDRTGSKDVVSPSVNSVMSFDDNDASLSRVESELKIEDNFAERTEPKRESKVSKSQSLDADDEWIDLFYTAL